jgi:hypothetical protein
MVCPKAGLYRVLVFASALAISVACSKSEDGGSLPPEKVDSDDDMIPDKSEDRNQNGTVDPGETDPAVPDTDGDGVLDEVEVASLACAKPNDRPFAVYDIPGADSIVLVDAKVSERTMLRTMDNKAPGASLVDPDLDVAAVLIGKRPASGVATPSAQRDLEQRILIDPLGEVTARRTRALTTVQGYAAEQATYTIRSAAAVTSRGLAAELGTKLLNGAALTGLPAPGGSGGRDITIGLLTIMRPNNEVVILAAVAAAAQVSDDQKIRVDELTDGTNVARHGSFTRHVCDQFKATENNKLDIIWVIDDSGSMEDDQMAVREAADAFGDIFASAGVDFRVGVTRTRAQERMNAPARGTLEGRGMTADINEFKATVVVGAEGGWEPGLQTGLLAIDALLPKTPAGGAVQRDRLREDAEVVVIHFSDERDQDVECAACGACPEEPPQRQAFCTDPAAQPVIDRFVSQYTQRGAVTFALVGDLPNGCQQTSTRDDFEPGQGYVEVANATGGQFGSLCGDMRQNLEAVARAATGITSEYELSETPASASIRVAKGMPGAGVAIARSRTNGWDYDAERNRIVFYGDARPKKDEEIVVGYRRWDWQGNTDRPPGPTEGCDTCGPYTSCNASLDTVSCEAVCGDVVCMGGLACLPDEASCGDPSLLPPDDGNNNNPNDASSASAMQGRSVTHRTRAAFCRASKPAAPRGRSAAR